MDFTDFLDSLRRSPDYRDQIVHVQIIPARHAHYDILEPPLPAPLADHLARLGIRGLYTHQVRTIQAARAGHNVVVVTGTASGKTLCYNLAVTESLLADPQTRALYLFPTKALAQDQLKTLQELATGVKEFSGMVRPATYDGDTPSHQRRKIRESANFILSNPDMLHVGILPYHAKWARFFHDLKYVVLDEIHTYRGIFGSNVANVIRRLRRVARHYGSDPRFICCSATIANPKELAESLIGAPVEIVDTDGSPAGRKHFVLWNPALLDDTALLRRSANVEAQELMSQLVRRNVQTITFTKARVVAELIYHYLRDELVSDAPELAARVRSYRGGYLPSERRTIEKALFSGQLLGVTSTNALELGIDIGSLDACLIVGFPGTIASTLQQAGRAGRKSSDSLVVLLAYNDPIDQYLVRHPDYFFGQSPEAASVDSTNPYILAGHLGCAAFELPLADDDQQYFGPLFPHIQQALHADGKLRRIDDRNYWSTTDFPAASVGLRTIGQDTFSIVDTTKAPNTVIGSVDSISAPELVYPQAVYMHEGDTFLVRNLDLQGKAAYVERAELDYYTQPVLSSSIRVTGTRFQKTFSRTLLRFGDATVTWATIGFKKFKFYTLDNIGQAELDLPAQSLVTTALWLIPSDSLNQQLKSAGLKPVEGLVGIRNMMLVALPIIAMCDRRDLGGIVESSNTGKPAAFIYDRYTGGLGFAQRGYDEIARLLTMCYQMVAECPCQDGCPSCVGLSNLRPPLHQDPDLDAGPAIPDKETALKMLRIILDMDA